ncbi:MAG: RNA-binding protein [Proteobacteria bacterium]|nr:RNA-binding protein [Pseudomonadota bacterium]
MQSASISTHADVRLDVWLWAARFFKTRALAKQAVEHGRVSIDGQARKPSAPVHVGVSLRIERDADVFAVEVLALSTQRGPASVAQTLYRENEASRAAREAVRVQRRAEAAGYRPPAGKPDKRARRLIRALGDIDAQ